MRASSGRGWAGAQGRCQDRLYGGGFFPCAQHSLRRFTLDRLFKMLAALDRNIKVTVHVAPWRTGQGSASTPAG